MTAACWLTAAKRRAMIFCSTFALRTALASMSTLTKFSMLLCDKFVGPSSADAIIAKAKKATKTNAKYFMLMLNFRAIE